MSKVFKVQATWLSGTQVESEAREFKMLLDKPKEENGTDLGPKPSEVALQALGSCLIFAYLYAANRLEVAIDGLKVNKEIEKVHNLALKASPMYDNFINPIEVTDSFFIL